MYVGYKFRYYPSDEVMVIHTRDMDNDRFVYNMGKQWIEEHYKSTGKMLGRWDLQTRLPVLRQECPVLQATPAQCLQQSLHKIHRSYQNFFRRIKLGLKPGYPKWKRMEDTQSITYRQLVIMVGPNHLKLPKLGIVEVVAHRPVAGIIKTAIIIKNRCNQWFICLQVDDGVQQPIQHPNGRVLGVDLGLKDLVVCSDGMRVPHPHFLKRKLDVLAKLQQQLSRKTKGSKSYEKARLAVASAYLKLSNARADFMHKLSRILVDTNQVLVFETLDVQRMQQTRRLAQSISDAAWSMLVRFCKYKTARASKLMFMVEQEFPSSKLCSCCGRKNRDLRLEDRVWTCLCGAIHDRDLNASINLEQWGIKKIVLDYLVSCTLPENGVLNQMVGASQRI